MTKVTKNGTDVGELCRQSWMVILKSAPHKANFENDIPHHRDCQWSTIGRDWNWIKRKLFLLLWSPSFLLLLSNCCNKDTVGCNVQCDVCWVSQSLILSSCGNFLRVVRYRVSKKGTAHEYLTPKVMINRSTLVLLSTSIYDLVLLDVCHFHHLSVAQTMHFMGLSRYSCLYLGSCIHEFCCNVLCSLVREDVIFVIK